MNPPPTIVAWSTPADLDNGFVPPTSYTGPDIICHRVATPGGVEAPVKAGRKVEFQWTPWPTSHHGPVLDYMANCNEPCKTVDKTTLKWFKIDHKGLLSGGNPGNWATDTLIANNMSWTVIIPPTLKTSNYVIRHEIIALHAAGGTNGAQSYPFCFNMAVTGTGSAAPSGISAETFYTPSDPGILVNIYQTLSTYIIPGPTVWSGAVSMSQTLPAAPKSTGVGIHAVK
jgi:lytic cellulose monooxygenase (C1-hydroxylating)